MPPPPEFLAPEHLAIAGVAVAVSSVVALVLQNRQSRRLQAELKARTREIESQIGAATRSQGKVLDALQAVHSDLKRVVLLADESAISDERLAAMGDDLADSFSTFYETLGEQTLFLPKELVLQAMEFGNKVVGEPSKEGPPYVASPKTALEKRLREYPEGRSALRGEGRNLLEELEDATRKFLKVT